MGDDLASLGVVFTANIDQLSAAESAIDSIFQNVASSAATSGADITESMTTAAESFSSITEAATTSASEVGSSVAGVTEALDALPVAGEEAGSSLSSSLEQASSGFSALEDAIFTLADSVNNAVAQIDAQIESIGTTAEESTGKAQNAGSGFNLGGMINQVGMGIFSLQAMGNMAAQTAGSLLGPASAAENTQASFSNLLGSTQAATNELGQLNDFAAKTQFKTQDIDNAAASMIAFKTPTADIIPRLTAVGDALTAVGKGTPAEMQSVVDILGKIGIQGKLTQGDITQLGAHGINALDLITEGSGKTTKQIQDMIAKGTLPAKDAIDDLTKGIESNPVYSGGMAKQAGTLSGQMSTLSSDFDQVMAAALKPALPELEQDFGKLTDVLTSPSFKQFAVVMGQDIATGVHDAVIGIKSLVDNGKNVSDFFSKNKTAMDGLKAVLIGTAVAIGAAVVPAFWAWAVAAGAAAIATLTAAAPFIAIGAIVAAVAFGIIEAVQHWGDITKWLSDRWNDFTHWWQSNWDNILHIAEIAGLVLLTIMTGGIALLVFEIVSHWQQITDFIGDKWHDIQNILGGVGAFFSGIGQAMWSGIKWGINAIITGIDDFIGAIDSIQIHIPAVGVGPFHTPSFDWNGVGLGKIPHLSTGGTVAPGEFAVVGDPGPYSEIVAGGTSGLSVFSHDQSMGMLGGSGSGGVTHVHVHIGDQEMASFLIDPLMDKVVKRLRALGGKMVMI